MTDQIKRVYEIKSIYVKDLSFESPKSPKLFIENSREKSQASNIDIDINTQFLILNEEQSLFDVVLLLRITAKSAQDVHFLIELAQSAIVEISGFSDTDLNKLLNIAVPNVLLPYARETVSSLVMKGGFPPMILRPINFEQIYYRKLKAEQERNEGQHTEH